MIKRILGALLTSLSLSTGVVQAAETAGAGSTFVFPILEKWAAAYEAKTGDKIRYESIGSGAGHYSDQGGNCRPWCFGHAVAN